MADNEDNGRFKQTTRKDEDFVSGPLDERSEADDDSVFVGDDVLEGDAEAGDLQASEEDDDTIEE